MKKTKSIKKEIEKKEKEISLIDKWNEHMKIIENKTGIHGGIVILVLIITIIIVYLNVFDADALITNLVGTIYPAFWTMKTIETNSNDDKHWLTYWVCFATFNIIDTFSGFILRFIPFYFILKIIFLIWLFMPNSHGATLVYQLLVVRLFKSFENDIDNATKSVKNYTNEFVKNNNFDGYQNFKKGIESFYTKRSESQQKSKKPSEINLDKELKNLNKIENKLSKKDKKSVTSLRKEKGNLLDLEKLKKD